MSQSYLLDTNVLLHLIRGKDLGTKIDQAFGLTSSMHRQVVSIVTEAELLVMADRKNWGAAKRDALTHALDSLVIVPIDGIELVQAYVTISSVDFATPQGARNMGKNDIWIDSQERSSQQQSPLEILYRRISALDISDEISASSE